MRAGTSEPPRSPDVHHLMGGPGLFAQPIETVKDKGIQFLHARALSPCNFDE